MTVLFGFEPEVVWISMDLTPIRFESDYSAFGFSFSRNRKPAKSTLPGCIPKRVQVPTQNRTVAEPLGPEPKVGWNLFQNSLLAFQRALRRRAIRHHTNEEFSRLFFRHSRIRLVFFEFASSLSAPLPVR